MACCGLLLVVGSQIKSLRELRHDTTRHEIRRANSRQTDGIAVWLGKRGIS